MADEDVQVVRDAWTSWLGEGPQAILPFLDPDVAWTPPADEPDSSTHRGPEAVLELLNGWLEAFAELRAEPLEVEDAGYVVIVSTVYCARMHGGDAVIETPEVHVVELRDSKIVEVRGFRTIDQARRTLRARP